MRLPWRAKKSPQPVENGVSTVSLYDTKLKINKERSDMLNTTQGVLATFFDKGLKQTFDLSFAIEQPDGVQIPLTLAYLADQIRLFNEYGFNCTIRFDTLTDGSIIIVYCDYTNNLLGKYIAFSRESGVYDHIYSSSPEKVDMKLITIALDTIYLVNTVTHEMILPKIESGEIT